LVCHWPNWKYWIYYPITTLKLELNIAWFFIDWWKIIWNPYVGWMKFMKMLTTWHVFFMCGCGGSNAWSFLYEQNMKIITTYICIFTWFTIISSLFDGLISKS
jgi:hypothetical protein